MMVNSIDDFSIGRRNMNSYVKNLVNLVCGASGVQNKSQVDTFIKNVMRKEDISYETRFAELEDQSPTFLGGSEIGSLK